MPVTFASEWQTPKELIADANLLAQCEWTLSDVTFVQWEEPSIGHAYILLQYNATYAWDRHAATNPPTTQARTQQSATTQTTRNHHAG